MLKPIQFINKGKYTSVFKIAKEDQRICQNKS